MSKPKTFNELFAFYYQEVKPLYSELSAANEPPIELLLEINAAFDHMSRHWQYGEAEEGVVGACSAHLKRCTFDGYKLILKWTRDHYDELMESKQTRIDVIDNGMFRGNLIKLWDEIRGSAIAARIAEGNARSIGDLQGDGWHHAFDLWKAVYVKCHTLNSEYYLSPKVEWARTRTRKEMWRDRLVGSVGTVVVGLVINFLYDFLKSNP
ncbi:MAG: hypothetical protein HQL80_09435 [Magnetococcales bacterium]|nr:hypothetical protein [Magnetococcales bacterium]